MNQKIQSFSNMDQLKFGVISDTHGLIDPDVENSLVGCDAIFHLGDIGHQRVLESLNNLASHVWLVAGNNDNLKRWPNADVSLLSSLPRMLSIKLSKGIIIMEHGHLHGHIQPSHQSLRQTYSDARIVFYGHTHKRTFDKKDTPWVINPGAAGRVRNHGGSSCVILTIDNDNWDVECRQFLNSS